MKKVFVTVTFTNNNFSDYIIKNVTVRKFTGELVDLTPTDSTIFHLFHEMYKYVFRILKNNDFQPRQHVDFDTKFYEIAWIDISYDPVPRYYAYNGH